MKCPSIQLIGVPEEDKKKDHEKILEEIIVENFSKMGKEIIIQVQEAQRGLKQDKPKVKHPKTHINLINKDQLLSLWESPCVLFVVFPLLILIFVIFV